jgi:UDP-N-acetyl-D-galactosamine dehydrogenase
MRAARKVNDEMEKWVFKDFKVFAEKKEINIYSNVVTILGYSFKENCNDTRNTKVKDLIFLMKDEGIEVNLWDPLISKEDRSYLNHNGVKTLLTKPLKCDIAVLCVSHQEVLEFLKEFNGFIYDYRKIYSLD